MFGTTYGIFISLLFRIYPLLPRQQQQSAVRGLAAPPCSSARCRVSEMHCQKTRLRRASLSPVLRLWCSLIFKRRLSIALGSPGGVK